MNAADLITRGVCDGRCLVSDSPAKGCDCRCGGRYHGHLRDAELDGPAPQPTTTANPLVGLYVHVLSPECCWCVDYQGEVLGHVQADRYLVRLFDWWFGDDEGERRVMTLDDDRTLYYHDAQAMGFAYDHRGVGSRRDHCDKHEPETEKPQGGRPKYAVLKPWTCPACGEPALLDREMDQVVHDSDQQTRDCRLILLRTGGKGAHV